jgi:hypothetical protein
MRFSRGSVTAQGFFKDDTEKLALGAGTPEFDFGFVVLRDRCPYAG